MNKPMVVHPGASWSTHDVFLGVTEALRRAGRPFAEFRLDGRIKRAHEYLEFVRQCAEDDEPEKIWPEVTRADITDQASTGLVERAIRRGCDALLVITGVFLPVEMLRIAKAAGLQVHLLCTESPYEAIETVIAAEATTCWTNERTAVQTLRAVCQQTHYLPHAWRAGVHEAPPPLERGPGARAHDVVFVGTYFKERVELLEAVDWTGIDLGLYGHVEMIPETSPLRRFIRGEVVPNEMAARLYRLAAVGLNLYRTTPAGLPTAESLNPRAYELAAAGACQVSQRRAETAEIFGDAVPTFETAEELEVLVRELVGDPDLRGTFGAAAQAAVAGATWDARLAQMLADLGVAPEMAVA